MDKTRFITKRSLCTFRPSVLGWQGAADLSVSAWIKTKCQMCVNKMCFQDRKKKKKVRPLLWKLNKLNCIIEPRVELMLKHWSHNPWSAANCGVPSRLDLIWGETCRLVLSWLVLPFFELIWWLPKMHWSMDIDARWQVGHRKQNLSHQVD